MKGDTYLFRHYYFYRDPHSFFYFLYWPYYDDDAMVTTLPTSYPCFVKAIYSWSGEEKRKF